MIYIIIYLIYLSYVCHVYISFAVLPFRRLQSNALAGYIEKRLGIRNDILNFHYIFGQSFVQYTSSW